MATTKKKKENPTFLHVANHRHENLFKAPFMIGGFYNWHLAFGEQGSFKLFKAQEGKLANYDIIFIGMSKPELDGCCASRIRRELGANSETKLVVCIDYAIELWERTFNPLHLENELMSADMVFISEPVMVSYVKCLVNDKIPVHHIPHPTNINAMRQYTRPVELRTDEIVATIHRYDNNWLAPFLVTKDLPWNTHGLFLDPQVIQTMHAFYKYKKAGLELIPYLEWVSSKKVVLDSYHRIHSYGRSAVDCACLKMPIVGSDVTWAQKFLWPELTASAGDISAQKEIIIKLMQDDDFYDKVINEADSKVEFFNYENRRKDLLDKLYA